jgi:hypothetical protein
MPDGDIPWVRSAASCTEGQLATQTNEWVGQAAMRDRPGYRGTSIHWLQQWTTKSGQIASGKAPIHGYWDNCPKPDLL